MLHRDRFILSSLFCVGLAFGGDPFPDTMGGKWVGQMPNGHTELTAPGNMPKGPELTPQYEKPNPPGGGSSGWGILGFIANLGKKSAKEKRMDAVMEAIEKADSKLKAGIPFDSADYAAMGTADLTKAHTYPKAPVIIKSPMPVKATPAVAAVIKSSSSAPHAYEPGMQLPKGMTSCTPFDAGSSGIGAPTLPVPKPSMTITCTPTAPKTPNMESLANGNPLKGLSGPQSGGGMGVGGAMQGAGSVVALTGIAVKTVATTTAVPVAVGGTVAAGGTAAAGGTVVAGGGAAATGGVVVVATTPWIPIIAVGTVLGLTIAGTGIATYEYFARPDDGFFFKSNKAPSVIPQYTPSNNAPQPNTPNPKRPEDELKDRKFNNVQRTEAMNKIKKLYRYDNQSNKYKLKDNAKALKCTRTGKPIEAIDWDGAHGDIETYRDTGHHMGSLDPVTYEMYKGPVHGRKVKL